MSALNDAARALTGARRVVIFSGAGMSAESGIDTFRSDGGLWERYPPEEFATPMGLVELYASNPARLARFLGELIGPVARAAPNPGHRALGELERDVIERGGEVVVVTQNVDRLHQTAGSARVHEIHGSLFDIVDAEGRGLRRLDRDQLAGMVEALERAQRGPFKRVRVASALSPLLGLSRELEQRLPGHRPSVVLFGEALAEPAWTQAQEAARRADALLIVGTSGLVYPAATIPELAAEAGAHIIEVGPEEVYGGVWLKGRAGELLPALIDKMSTLSP